VMLVDIGGSTTDVAIFVQGGVWHTSVIPVGGSHFTNDIVYVLHTPHNTAEYLKLKYGSAIAGDAPEDGDAADLLDAETLVVGEKQQVSRHLLNEIIQSRAEQVVEMLYNEIKRSGYEGMLPAGIVLTGGAAQLSRFDELTREMLGIPVRVGVPTELSGLADSLDSPSYSTGVGLLRWGARHGLSMLGPTHRSEERQGWGNVYERFKGWLREFLP
jgi:cell division protein FtsA